MNNFYYYHFWQKPIGLEISNFNVSVQSIFSMLADLITLVGEPISE